LADIHLSSNISSEWLPKLSPRNEQLTNGYLVAAIAVRADQKRRHRADAEGQVRTS
jgi:hypothetical protein